MSVNFPPVPVEKNPATVTAAREFPFLELIRKTFIVLGVIIGAIGIGLFLITLIVAIVDMKFGPSVVTPLATSLGLVFAAVCSAAMGELIRLVVCIEINTRPAATRR